jgi:hypothetical protein
MTQTKTAHARPGFAAAQAVVRLVVRKPRSTTPKKKHAKLPTSHKLTPEEINQLKVEGFEHDSSGDPPQGCDDGGCRSQQGASSWL